MQRSVNPATGIEIASYELLNHEQIRKIITKAGAKQKTWQNTSFYEKALCLKKAGQILKDRKEEYAHLITLEMGKPLREAISEIEKCAWVCHYYADLAEKFLSPKKIVTDAYKSYVSYQALGTVLGIMPWNFPFWQVFRFAAPTLMAGNTIILKHAPNVGGCAQVIAKLWEEAGLPSGVFKNVFIPEEQVEALISSPYIQAVSLTGSTRAGKSVASLAGKYLKKCVLELGGSDPYIVLKDAKLNEAVAACMTSRLFNNGQSCIAAKRFIVVEEVYEEFVNLFTSKMKTVSMGNPLKDDYDHGPLAREGLRQNLHRQVKESIDTGANCLLGGQIPTGKGYYYPATVLSNVSAEMPVFREETFGPVASITPAKNETNAIELANNSIYGLGAAIFTEDYEKGEFIANSALKAGNCFVNSLVKSDPRLPFGGIKNSGYGRELSTVGIHEFVNIKTVYLK